VYKNFKIRKIIDHSDMFQIVCDPLSGSIELYLAEIRSGSLTFVMFGSIILNQWCVCVRACVRARYDGLRPSYHTHTSLVQKLRCQTPTKHTTNISEPLWISAKYSFILPDDGSHTIRNISEWFLILCLLTFIQRRF